MTENLPIQIYSQLDAKPAEGKLMELFQQDPALKILLAILKLIKNIDDWHHIFEKL